MTTIAACKVSGVMSADSIWTDEDSRGITKKVFRVRGDLIGGAGSSIYLDPWLAAYRKRQPLPKPRGSDISIIRLSAAGIDVWEAVNDWLRIEERAFAIGTGGKAARAAMMAGASCAAAVRICCLVDASSGGRVRVYHLLRKGD